MAFKAAIKKTILPAIAFMVIASIISYTHENYMRNLPIPKPIETSDSIRINTIEIYLLRDAAHGYSFAVARVTAVHYKSDLKRTVKEAIYRHPFQGDKDQYPETGVFTTIKMLYGKPIPDNNSIDNSDAIKEWNEENEKKKNDPYSFKYTHGYSISSDILNMRLGEYWLVVYDPVKKRILTSMENGTTPLTGPDDPLIDAFSFVLRCQNDSYINDISDKLESVLNDKSVSDLHKELAISLTRTSKRNNLIYKRAYVELRYNKLMLSLLKQKGISHDLRIDAVDTVRLTPQYIKTNAETRLLCQYMMSALQNSKYNRLKWDIQSRFHNLLLESDELNGIYYYPDIYNLLKSKGARLVTDVDYSKVTQRSNDHVIRIPPLGTDTVSKALYEASFE